MTIYSYVFVSILVISLASLGGAAVLALGQARLQKWMHLLVSFAAGALLGDVFLHVLPELAEDDAYMSMGIGLLVGVWIFFLLERLIHMHHGHGDKIKEEHKHLLSARYLIIFGDGLHNFMDGLAIAAAFQINLTVGIATSIAVLLHEIPHELGDFAVLLHSGYKASRALLVNFLSALTAFAGAGLGFLLGEFGVGTWVLSLAAASFLYIAMSDLLPELHRSHTKERGWWKDFAMLILGGAVMAMLLLLE